MKIVIKGEPVTKKNSQRIVVAHGRPLIMPSAKYKEYEKMCALYVHPLEQPIDYGVNVKCLFYKSTRRKSDVTNHLQAVLDILVKYKVLADDNFSIVWSVDGSRVLYDKDNPRTEIEITKIGE